MTDMKEKLVAIQLSVTVEMIHAPQRDPSNLVAKDTKGYWLYFPFQGKPY